MSQAPAVVVVDYGVNNVGSVVNMLRHLDGEETTEAVVARRPSELASAEAIVLPGIGAFDTGVTSLQRAELFDMLIERARAGVPLLGICLGMQLLSRGSEEGSLPGLGLIPASTRKLPAKAKLRIPHMGWNETDCVDPQLFAGFEHERPRFYFVHSYHVVCDAPATVAATCTYGEPFTAAVRHDNVFGTQFHPEKSHRFGKQVLANFVRAAREIARA